MRDLSPDGRGANLGSSLVCESALRAVDSYCGAVTMVVNHSLFVLGIRILLDSRMMLSSQALEVLRLASHLVHVN